MFYAIRKLAPQAFRSMVLKLWVHPLAGHRGMFGGDSGVRHSPMGGREGAPPSSALATALVPTPGPTPSWAWAAGPAMAPTAGGLSPWPRLCSKPQICPQLRPQTLASGPAWLQLQPHLQALTMAPLPAVAPAPPIAQLRPQP